MFCSVAERPDAGHQQRPVADMQLTAVIHGGSAELIQSP